MRDAPHTPESRARRALIGATALGVTGLAGVIVSDAIEMIWPLAAAAVTGALLVPASERMAPVSAAPNAKVRRHV